MNDEFTKYLAALGMPSVFIQRIETVSIEIATLCPEEITGIFVSDFIKEDGSREYDSIFFFSRNYILEARRFLTDDDYDSAIMGDSIRYISIKKQEYDLKKATDKSRINFRAYLDNAVGIGGLSFEMKASKENCDYLLSTYERFIKPNFKKASI